jgi:hypothetical protein
MGISRPAAVNAEVGWPHGSGLERIRITYFIGQSFRWPRRVRGHRRGRRSRRPAFDSTPQTFRRRGGRVACCRGGGACSDVRQTTRTAKLHGHPRRRTP